ncbi:MAG: hypothetical protein HW421_588 [Ignavibacteria bacterium]|nr:hypothetical protein [Ignavibacteria bacterium]
MIDRINIDKSIMGGKPVIKGTRLTVQFILGLLSKGMTHSDILLEYPDLTFEDIEACLNYASEKIDELIFI